MRPPLHTNTITITLHGDPDVELLQPAGKGGI